MIPLRKSSAVHLDESSLVPRVKRPPPLLRSIAHDGPPTFSIVHRGKVLEDADYVPDDAVDVGEHEQMEAEMDAENSLDLSYLWVVDTRTLRLEEAQEVRPPGGARIHAWIRRWWARRSIAFVRLPKNVEDPRHFSTPYGLIWNIGLSAL